LLTVRAGLSAIVITCLVILLATIFALGGALANVFELPNKIGMGRAVYFVAQTIHSGWNRLAYTISLKLIGMVATIETSDP